MIQDFAPSQKKLWHLIARESLAFLGTVLLYPLGGLYRKKTTPRMAKQRTVVFVHGYLSNASAFTALLAYLKVRGVQNTLHFQYNIGNSVERSAIELQKFLKTHVRGGRIDLVCHSLGGVIAKVYINELGGDRKVDRCVTLGSPLQGTYNAYWMPTRVGNDLRPDSALMKRLAKYGVSKTRFTTIAAGSDNIVLPRVFASGSSHSPLVPHTGHFGLLFSPAVFRETANALLAS